MTYLTLLAAVPPTLEWGPKTAIVMVVCNVLAIAIGKLTIQYSSEGPALPSPNLFGGFGLPALLATTSLGHILGVGVLFGLASTGAL